ncbi:MAG: SUMF1/EgtB/PvdO family nonheme iron enzyme [Verrucomicrobiota bacterium]
MKSSSRTAAVLTLVGLSPIPAAIAAVDFVKDIQPILENNCVSCHNEKQAKGGVRLHTVKQALTSGDNGASLVPGNSAKSPLYTTMVLPEDDDLLMPPKKKGGPLPKETSNLIRTWIDEGAVWPADLVLVSKKKEEASKIDETALVEDIHKKIQEQSPAIKADAMKPYSEKIMGTDVVFDLVAIPGGKYKMGSAESESDRSDDEGPQRPVEISPFWMGKCEVTWNEFELFMYPTEEKRIRAGFKVDSKLNELTDASARPTQPYVEMSFGMGKDGYPAISMTQHAANKYCEWLSAKTGHFYRLPTEAEWEYAARAGTTTAYFWGDDAAPMNEYCWWGENSNGKYQKVGQKKPNPWGLHDILGNVMEWTLDQYAPDAYAAGAAKNPWVVATKPYPHVARGGAWDADSADKLRVAARRFSDPDWKIQDPQFPKSVWYHTDAQFLGFRVVRPLETPSAAEMKKIWNSGVEKD